MLTAAAVCTAIYFYCLGISIRNIILATLVVLKMGTTTLWEESSRTQNENGYNGDTYSFSLCDTCSWASC